MMKQNLAEIAMNFNKAAKEACRWTEVTLF